MSLETIETLKAKFDAKLGFTPGRSGLDALRREDYVTEDDFLNAVAKYDLENNNPEFAEAKRRAKIEYDRRMSEREQEEINKAMQEAAKGVKLAEIDEKNAEARARERAKQDLAQGRITAREMGNAISEYYDDERDRIQLDAQSNASMNAAIRTIFRQQTRK